MSRSTRHGLGALAVLLAAAGSAASCAESAAIERSKRWQQERELRGQSGSEVTGSPSGSDTVPCPCGGNFEGSALARVTLVARTASASITGQLPWCEPNPPYSNPYEEGSPVSCERLTLHVDELLYGDATLPADSVIEADSDGYLPCFRGLAAVDTGAQALAFLRWIPVEFPACEARQACLDQCAWDAEVQLYGGNWDGGERPCHPEAGPPPDACRLPVLWCRGSCNEGFDGVCAPRPEPTAAELRERWVVKLAPWGESIPFAQIGDAKVSALASELPLLWSSGGQCRAKVGDWADLPGAFPGGSDGI